MSNPKPGLRNINVNIKFGENQLRLTQDVVLKQNYVCVAGK